MLPASPIALDTATRANRTRFVFGSIRASPAVLQVAVHNAPKPTALA